LKAYIPLDNLTRARRLKEDTFIAPLVAFRGILILGGGLGLLGLLSKQACLAQQWTQ
jgi:hypothetical protein